LRFWSKSELKQFLIEETAYEPRGKASLKVEVNKENAPLWEFKCKSRHAAGQISVLPQNDELRKSVIRSLDRIGATELSITNIWDKKTRKTNQDNWEDWFLSNFVSPNLSKPIYLVPDTNFIMRRYASGLLRRMGEEKFKLLRFEIPNFVILEIEAKYNREKKKSENKKCKSDERQAALMKKGETLIATKELLFLIDKGAQNLSSDMDEKIFSQFAKTAGRGFADSFIRNEIRTSFLTGTHVFLTCDLMNALAATAEGISTLYFSRSDSEIGRLSSEHDMCMEQLSELIVDTAFVFGEITLAESLSSGKQKIMKFGGSWDSWGLPDLFDDKIAQLDSP